MSASFHTLTVAEVRRETPRAISVLLAVPADLQTPFRFKPGQHLALRARIGGMDVVRNYSICSAPHENELRVAIKEQPGGIFSQWANTSLAAGSSVEVMPPHGSFSWEFLPERKALYAGFASGSGITPILSLIKTALQVEPHSTFHLFYGNRTAAQIMFLEELAALKDRYMDRFVLHHFLSEEHGDAEILNGRLDQSRVADILAHLIAPERIDAAFLCGPAGMMDAAAAQLAEAGLQPGRILMERFSSGELSDEQLLAAQRLGQQANGRPMRLTLGGRRRTMHFRSEQGSILDSARDAGLPAPFACKAGVCATCRARVVSGKVEMVRNYALTGKEIAAGYVLTCQAIPVSDDVELNYDV